nr:insulin-like growth factor-binding protein complex acid labile subunit [Procambarus clarkii]XP_045610670.1 insulin-like growth factor-binding protein complex acid labile subunit [Procambarus clarkii]XP_045610671.1 insulin-like growth factor-binding protein complex acid labile subunit [Procambarus clarkii]
MTCLAMVRLWLLCAVAACVAAAPPGSCPRMCFCPLDPRGRRQVICNTGGLVDPLPVLDMPSDAEVLEVGAPPGRPNALTLGPIFKDHRRLEKLSVTGSGVPALGAHSFWGLRRLHTLNVSNNAITAVIDTNFRGADSLHTLDLSHNQVESVPSAVFRHIRNLRFLSLANNRLPEIVPRILYGLSLLETLDISHNPLGILPSDRFTDAPNLRELRCAACGLQTVSEQLLRALPELRVLDLRLNRLTEVPPIAVSRHLTTLHLDYNHVSTLMPNGLSGPPLSTLTLANNRISSLSVQAMANSTLTFFDLAYNRLTRLRTDALSDGFTRLRYLRLTGNPLQVEKLVQVIPRARQLRQLELAELGMTHLPGDLLRQSRHLKILNVSGNYLSGFPVSALFATPHLITLDLSHNNFRGLEQDLVTAFTTMASLEKVWLQGNPWQCQQCHVAPMLDWLRDPSASRHPHAESICRDMPMSPRCLRCMGPQELAGQELQLLDKTHVPECVQEAPAWPSWLGDTQSDDPRSPRNHQTAESIEETDTSLEVFFGDHMALIVGVGCGLVLALLLVVVAAILLARRHSALYYTNEPADHDSSQKLMSRNNNDNSPPGPRSPPRASTPYTTRTGASIATIEEVDSIAGSTIDLQIGKELRAPRIVRLAASPLP